MGKWTSENCSDPKNLFESIVSRLEDVIDHTSYEYYDTEKDTIEIETNDLAKEWQAYDNKIYGRCFTLSPSEKHTRYRIRSIVMKWDYFNPNYPIFCFVLFESLILGRFSGNTYLCTHSITKIIIRSISLLLNRRVDVYFHTPGMFQTARPNTVMKQYQYIEFGRMVLLDFKHELHETVDFGGQPCITDYEYSKDSCTHQATEVTAMENFG